MFDTDFCFGVVTKLFAKAVVPVPNFFNSVALDQYKIISMVPFSDSSFENQLLLVTNSIMVSIATG